MPTVSHCTALMYSVLWFSSVLNNSQVAHNSYELYFFFPLPFASFCLKDVKVKGSVEEGQESDRVCSWGGKRR